MNQKYLQQIADAVAETGLDSVNRFIQGTNAMNRVAFEPLPLPEIKLDGTELADSQGRPRSFFHGTTQNFVRFEVSPRGWTHTAANPGNVHTAPPRCGFYFTSSLDRAKTFGPIIMEVHLSIRNPLYVGREPENLTGSLMRRLIDQGYDGVFGDEIEKEPGDGYVVFDPAQIRVVGRRFYDRAGHTVFPLVKPHPLLPGRYTMGPHLLPEPSVDTAVAKLVRGPGF